MIHPLPDLGPHIAEIASAILGEPNERLSTRTQLRFGTNGSFAVETSGKKRGQWYDHEAGMGGGPWDLLVVKGRMTNGEAREWITRNLGIEFGPKMTSASMVAYYDYRDETGELLFQVCRFEPKDFRQRRPDGNDGWIWQVKGSRIIPYRLRELIASSADTEVWIVEGEKDADRLAGLGIVATCNPGGAAKVNGNAKAKSKWHPDLNRFFTGRKVTVIPDNDNAGRAHARAIALNLTPIAARVRILEPPGLPPKGDISDWFDAGGTWEELERLAAIAPTYPPELDAETIAAEHNILDDHAEIARLAALPMVAYGRERKVAAVRFGCPLVILDRAVSAERGNSSISPGQGRALDLPEPEPWPDPVGGAELLDELTIAIRRYVVLDPHQADAVVLWVLAVHAFDVWTIFPRLIVTAPEKQCGKTTLLDWLSRLVPQPLVASGITAAALFRTIEATRPTLLLDEADAYARNNEDLRAVLDAGHRCDGAVIRTVGDNHEPRQFSAWAPVALAAIGHMPGTIEDRSIIVRLRRRRPDETVDSLRLDRAGELDALARKAARWAADHKGEFAATDPAMPGGIYNRAADNWRPLLAVADVAGGCWPDRARHAAELLARDGAEDGETARTMLLADLRKLFEAEPSGVLFTKKILAALHKDETRPWPEWKNGKPITDRQLAALLKDLRIKPMTVRRGSETEKGYKLEWFEDVFVRYLTPFQSATASQVRNSAAFEPPRSVTAAADVTDRHLGRPSTYAGCDGVTDPHPLWWRNGADEWTGRDPEEAVWTE
jgi:putative DNA primase/helicase